MSDLFAYFSRAQQSIVEQVQQVNVDEVKSNIWSFVKNVSAIAMGEAAAEDIGIVYVKPQLIAMEFPSRDTRLNGVPADNMGKWLMEKHKGKFMVYNLSDRNYDYAIFQDQVIEFKFPGYPAPPLDKVFSICKAIDGWVKADDENVVAVHCQTGKGRTITVLACYLAWVKEFKSAIEAAEYIAKLKKQPLDKLLIPTQHRYISYFDNLLTSKLPSRKHLRLQKIIINTIPNFEPETSELKGGCRPYLQIFKHAQLLYSSASQSGNVRHYSKDDGSIVFNCVLDLEGDILIRVRQMSDKDNRATMFRIGFHAGFVSSELCRFEKNDIDGAQNSPRFNNDFFVDLVFTSSTDADGKEVENNMDSEFWSTVTHRSPKKVKSPKEKADKKPQPISLFNDVVSENKNSSDAKPSSRAHSPNANDEEFFKLDEYVKGLDTVSAEQLNAESDNEGDDVLLERLKQEFDDVKVQSPSGEKEADKLDDDVQAILSQLE